MNKKQGKILSGFEIKKIEYVEEVYANAYIMEHIHSGARLLYLESDDDNKVFSIGFRTPPDNSKGTPHIMEHSVLCGSRKYPLKEPFVELAKGSLNTFLNAMTWPDKTLYPIASRNMTDFFNLMDVYLDAVFYPNCIKDKQILMQEGWHYEMENAEDPLIYNGVVYNEMKGALSSAESIMESKAFSELFPHTTYGVESGGDPDFIPSLSFREFKEFHHRYYHPSNSYIFLYGDMDIEKTLAYLDGEYLSHFDKRDIKSAVETESPFLKRKECEYPYGITENESEKGKGIHALYIAMNDSMSTLDSLALKVLNYILLMADGAPLAEALVKAGVGSDVSGGYMEDFKQPVWIMEVTGSDAEKKEEFTSVIDGEIRRIIAQGLDKDMIRAALNRIEFISRENDFQGRPKGLFYAIRSMNYWLYDKEPLQGLRYIDDIEALRARIDTDYFENLLIKYVLKNYHQLRITMHPQKGFEEEKQAKIAKKLEAYKKSLTKAEIESIIQDTRALKVHQATGETEEALMTIPLLSRKDLNRPVEDDKVEEGITQGISHFHFSTHTNSITYLNLFFRLQDLEVEDLPYVHLIAQLLKSMDAGSYSYGELERLVNEHTGGLGFSVTAYGNKEDANRYLPVFVVRGKALTEKVEHLLNFLGTILNDTHFDKTVRLRELLMENKSSWDMRVFDTGHTLMMLRLSSYFSGYGKFSEQFGMTYYYFLTDLIHKFDENPIQIVEKIQEVAKKIFTKANLFIETIGEEAERQAVAKHIHVLLKNMDEGCQKAFQFTFPSIVKNEAFSTAGKVQYVAKGGNFKGHGFVYSGAIPVMETILRYEYLWKKVRVLGGAYGAFTQFARNGTAILCSYRDPNLSETISAYDGVPEYLENLELSEREMTKYVIGTMSPLETQLTPFMRGERAMMWHLQGITKEDREQTRKEIIDCTVEDIRALAPLLKAVLGDNQICVMGGASRIKRDTSLFNRILTMPE